MRLCVRDVARSYALARTLRTLEAYHSPSRNCTAFILHYGARPCGATICSRTLKAQMSRRSMKPISSATTLDYDLGFPQRVEDLAIEQFVTQAGIEALDHCL